MCCSVMPSGEGPASGRGSALSFFWHAIPMHEQHNKADPVPHALLHRQFDEPIPDPRRFEGQFPQEQMTTSTRSRT
jgi:hypothetical protein